MPSRLVVSPEPKLGAILREAKHALGSSGSNSHSANPGARRGERDTNPMVLCRAMLSHGNALTKGFYCLFVNASGVGCLDVLITTIMYVLPLKPRFSHIFSFQSI